VAFSGERFPVLFILLLALSASGTALAAPPCKGPHANDPGCDSGGGGGGDPPTEVNVNAGWVPGGMITGIGETLAWDEWDPPRLCTPENFTPSGDSGHYHCQHVPGVYDGYTAFDFSGVAWVQTQNRGDERLCAAMDGISMQADSQYGFGWDTNCKDAGGCTVLINNWFYGSDVADAVAAKLGPDAPRVDLVVVRGYADIPQLDAAADSNPFVDPQDLLVVTVTVTFSAEGKNKKLATCEYDTGSSAVPAIFESTPVP